MTSQKNTQNQKKYFSLQTQRLATFWGFIQLSSTIGGGLMELQSDSLFTQVSKVKSDQLHRC